MRRIVVRSCKTLAGTSERPLQLSRFVIDRKRYLQYRKLAWWQSSAYTDNHIAALRTKTERMEEGQPQETSDPAEYDSARKKPQFGTRFLTDPQSVFQHNAWDNVVWDEEQEAEAREKTLVQLQDALSLEKQEEYDREANAYWDKFYGQHQNRFFKDRHWLFTEFPELYSSQGNTNPETSTTFDSVPATASSSTLTMTTQHQAGPSSTSGSFPGEAATYRIFEVGCGVGNTVFPVLSTNNDPGLMMYCCDFSMTAVQLVKDHRDYDPKRCHAFVWDITDEEAKLPFPPESLDIVIMIFVLSAVHPDKMQQAVNRLASCLKPGGQILLRDYGRYDMAQLRFKKGRCLSENFYVRGDGTRVYFFTQEEFRAMFQQAGLEEVQNLIDRRLQVNRSRQLKMYRVWIQCKYRKPFKGVLSAKQTSS